MFPYILGLILALVIGFAAGAAVVAHFFHWSFTDLLNAVDSKIQARFDAIEVKLGLRKPAAGPAPADPASSSAAAAPVASQAAAAPARSPDNGQT